MTLGFLFLVYPYHSYVYAIQFLPLTFYFMLRRYSFGPSTIILCANYPFTTLSSLGDGHSIIRTVALADHRKLNYCSTRNRPCLSAFSFVNDPLTLCHITFNLKGKKSLKLNMVFLHFSQQAKTLLESDLRILS